MSLLSRRTLLQGGAGLATAVTLAHAESALALVRRVTGVASPLSRSRFTPLVGQKLQMSDAAASVPVRLIAIRDLRPAQRPNDERCFSLLFQAAPQVAWPQKVYRFWAPKLGTVSLFAVPVGSAGGYFEVVVNSPA